MGRKIVVTLALVGAMLALPATAAFAHDCFVANRSAQGATGAAKSGQWIAISLEEVFADDFQVPEENVDDAVADAVAAGLPEVFATSAKKVIAEGTGAEENGTLANGKGLEHFSQSPLGGIIFEIALEWGGAIPDFE